MIRIECEACQSAEYVDRHELDDLKHSDGEYHCEECDSPLYVDFG